MPKLPVPIVLERKDEMHGEKKTSASGNVTYNTGTSHLHMTDEFEDKKQGSACANSEVRNPLSLVTLNSVKLSAGRSWALASKD